MFSLRKKRLGSVPVKPIIPDDFLKRFTCIERTTDAGYERSHFWSKWSDQYWVQVTRNGQKIFIGEIKRQCLLCSIPDYKEYEGGVPNKNKEPEMPTTPSGVYFTGTIRNFDFEFGVQIEEEVEKRINDLIEAGVE